MISFFILIQLKHFIIDFLLQNAYQYKNKGTYGHPGGILHSFYYGMGTFLVLAILCVPFGWPLWWMVILEMVIHYHIDWAKVKLGHKTNWSALYGETEREKAHLSIYSDKYFWALGFDQYLHQITYIVLYANFFAL